LGELELEVWDHDGRRRIGIPMLSPMLVNLGRIISTSTSTSTSTTAHTTACTIVSKEIKFSHVNAGHAPKERSDAKAKNGQSEVLEETLGTLFSSHADSF
jgi:hypothetical protein